MKSIFNKLLSLAMFLNFLVPVRAEEGMWIPLLLEKYNIDDMHELGCRLSAEEIFSINQDCLADAVIIFSTGCTGEVISSEGLVLTNYHCGDNYVRMHSTLEENYLRNGYWAMERDEELPNNGLNATFLRYMKDVTDEVLKGIDQEMDEDQKELIINRNIAQVSGNATNDECSSAIVKPFYFGNAYYLFVYDIYRDVRLVGAPPESVGDFGQETDNWIWPRHTGDFLLFRIYADKDNGPAEYSPDNVPYKPDRHLEISLSGIREGDFTMILGYPGRTNEYYYSKAIEQLRSVVLPHTIALRQKRLDIMKSYMDRSDLIRIQYISKYNGVANYWKKWQGVLDGLDRMDAINKKVAEEEQFINWMKGDDLRVLKYDRIPAAFSQLYDRLDSIYLAMEYLDESVWAIELFRQSSTLYRMMSQGIQPDAIREFMAGFYEDFYLPVDRDIFSVMIEAFYNDIDPAFHPPFYDKLMKRYKGDFHSFAEYIYTRTLFSSPEKIGQLIETYADNQSGALKKLYKDPVYTCMNQFREMYMVKLLPLDDELNRMIGSAYRKYMVALQDMYGDSILYPDANFTMRVSYGEVEGYRPRDAVYYEWGTTMEGMMDKYFTGDQEYSLPDKLLELYNAKDYGEYGNNGTMPVCFIASNHTTGGNSGSPVLDADGRLIGINFDRNWEGTVSDIIYDPEQTRNISVDIRYVLFIIDKFAGAGYLLDEMEIVR